MEALNAIMNRRSTRVYNETPVTDAEIDTLLKAAMAAPSGVNRQPWEFYVLKSKEVQDKVKEVLPFGRFNSPLIILVALNQARTEQGPAHGLSYCDGGATTENILIAAKALDLDTCWCAVWPDEGKINAIRKALDIPFTIEPFSIIHVGHAGMETPAKNKWDPEKVHTL